MEPDISPLAKRLAEENNVNWRGLGGSGANGRIVERDVLEYLAKVMAGEEDINPTVEPVPEGMDAWPEEDTAGYFKENSPSIKATDTLTEVVTDMPSVSVEESDPFTLGEASDLEPASMDSSDDLFADLDSPPEPAIDDIASTFDAENDVHISEDIFLFDEGNEADPADETSDAATSFDAGSPLGEQEAVTTFESDAEANSGAADFDFGDAEAFTDVPGETVEADVLGETVENAEADAALEASDDLFATPEDSSADTTLFSDELSHDDTSSDTSLLKPVAASVEPTGATDDTLTGIEGETLTPAPLPATDLPLSTFGVLLRRHADLGAAMQAQLSISHELGHNEPIHLSSLLARAAAKALQTSDIAKGQGLGLALFEESGVRIASVENAHAAPFRDLLEQLSSLNADDTSTVGLAVADMSDFDVDEAVLNLDVPVLALGRIMQDSEQGSQHSTLTLSGDVPVEVGTKFLSTVAELLAAPIRLVL